jgi:hypothetical protein
MRLKVLLAVAGMSLFSATAWGTTCASAVGDTYNQLAAISGGCTATFSNYTVTFSNFTAEANGASIFLNQVDFNSGAGITGFQFTGASGTALPSFSTLGFTVTTSNCTVPLTCSVVGVYEQGSFLQFGNGAGVVTVTETAGVSPITLTPASSTFGPSGTGAVTSITESASYDGNNTLGNFETDFYTQAVNNTVPEPTTMLLLGTGLLGFGFIKKRRSARKS